jgi:hypothetical protein
VSVVLSVVWFVVAIYAIRRYHEHGWWTMLWIDPGHLLAVLDRCGLLFVRRVLSLNFTARAIFRSSTFMLDLAGW